MSVCGDGFQFQFVFAEIGDNAVAKAEIGGVGLATGGIERIEAVS